MHHRSRSPSFRRVVGDRSDSSTASSRFPAFRPSSRPRAPRRSFSAAVVAGAMALSLLLAATPGAAQDAVDAPLFASHEVLEIVLRSDFEALEGDRDQDEDERDGEARVTAPDGTVLTVPVEIRTRGNFRLQRSTCRFPPLRLDFPKGQVEGSILHGEDKLKLVGHCRDGDDWEQRVLKEYLVYRFFNLITDQSFKVRLARITYEQHDGSEDPFTRWGFLIEDEERLAERLGGEILETAQLHPARITGANAGPVVLFQYMVGNTDFSLYGDHNVKLVQAGNTVIPVPYDFDWTGVVDAPYAQPDPSLGTRSVRQRVFRGLCRPDVDYPSLYAQFKGQRAAIESLIRGQTGLEVDHQDDVIEYLEEFWEILDDEGKARRYIEEGCRRV